MKDRRKPRATIYRGPERRVTPPVEGDLAMAAWLVAREWAEK